MKKLLILGCSFSQGSFGENLAWSEGKSRPNPGFQFLQRSPKILEDGSIFYEDVIKDSLGWYHFVDMIKEFETTVFAFPGNGYSMWGQFLNIMADAGKLNEYDSIIIQESWEPRTCFCDILQLEEYVKNDFITISKNIDNITRSVPVINNIENSLKMGPRHLTGLLMVPEGIEKIKMREPLKKAFKQTLFSPLHDLIVEASARYIDNICKKYNINGYIFGMWQPFYNFVNITRIKLDIDLFSSVDIEKTLYNHLYHKGLLTHPNTSNVHQTLEGNKEIGRLINEQFK